MLASQEAYWFISIGATSIALQANEVAFIAPIADLNTESTSILISGQEIPVYSFNDGFQLIQCDTSLFRFCACLVSNQQGVFALAINSIQQEMLNSKYKLFDLPLIMSNPLFEKAVEIENKITLITNASNIWREIQSQLGVSVSLASVRVN